MKKITNLKAFVLSMAMALGMLLPMTMTAQSDGFFRSGTDNIDDRTGGEDGVTWNGMVAQNPEYEAPLGSGLLILTAAGAGYVALKRKRNLKTTATMILACVMLLGFTQCKKNVVDTVTQTEGIKMTLVADNGAKTSFDADGNIHWKDGVTERVFVFVDGECKGSLTNNGEGGNTFNGTLTDLVAGTYNFYFYYLGNIVDKNTINSGDTSFSMDFSNQDGTLANLGNNHFGCGIMEGVVYDGSGSITAQALMQSYVSIGLFNTAGMAESGEMVYFYGNQINNKISVSFSDKLPNYTYEKTHGGYICAGTPSAKTYVILVPNHTNGSESNPTAFTFVSKRTTCTVNETVFPYGIIGGRFYCQGGITDNAISITTTAYDPGKLRGDFSVASGTTVKFSQGNLQADFASSGTSTRTWQFATNQYDYVGNNVANTKVDNNEVTEAGIVDLFGWVGASSSLAPYGINNNGTSDDYGNTANEALKDDWGNVAISNGGNTASSGWRTLTKNEWGYLFTDRTTTSNHRFAKANVCGNNGVILLPDNWSDDIYSLTSYGMGGASYSANTIDANGWAKLEAAGCVFLPAAGYRDGTTVTIDQSNYYWSSTSLSSTSAYYLRFNAEKVVPDAEGGVHRHNGLSVRLVF